MAYHAKKQALWKVWNQCGIFPQKGVESQCVNVWNKGNVFAKFIVLRKTIAIKDL